MAPAAPHRCVGCAGGPVHDREQLGHQEAQDPILVCFLESISGEGAEARQMRSEEEWEVFKKKLQERNLLGADDLERFSDSPLASPEAWDVRIDKPRAGSLATPLDPVTLELGAVADGCVLGDWCRAHPERPLQRGDRIRRANGLERREDIIGAVEGRGVLALELVRPYLDVAGFQRWLCQRVWGDQLQRLDRDLEAARAAIRCMNIAVGFQGVDKLNRLEYYTYAVLLSEYEHATTGALKVVLKQAKDAEQAAGGPWEAPAGPPDLAPPAAAPAPAKAPTPVVSARGPVPAGGADAAAPPATEPAPLPTTPEAFQWSKGPEIERRLRELRVPAVSFPPGAAALERTAWGVRRFFAAAVTTGEEVEVLEVPWDVPLQHAATATLLTNRVEALKQLVLSPHFPDYLGSDFSSYEGAALHFLRKRQGVCLRRLLSELGPLPERHALLRHWSRELLLALRDYLYQCCQEVTEDITLAHVFVYQEGTGVLLQGVPFGDTRGALNDEFPEYGPDRRWRNGFDAMEARLVTMFASMMLEMLRGDAGGKPVEPLLVSTEDVSQEMREILSQALNARDSLDHRLGLLAPPPPPPPPPAKAAEAPPAAGAALVGQGTEADAWVGLNSGLVALGLDEYGSREHELWWTARPRSGGPQVRLNLERVAGADRPPKVEAPPAAGEAAAEEEAPLPSLQWQPNKQSITLQALLDHPVFRRPDEPLMALMEAWHLLASRYDAARARDGAAPRERSRPRR